VTADRAPLDPDFLRSHAPSWRRLDVVDETGSTNADLVARAAAGEDIAGAVLLAEAQTAGKGRHGRSWTTPPMAQVALSAGVAVDGVGPDGWGWLPLLTGVAVADAVRAAAGVDAGLKWPNDVLVAGRKLAGILAEVAAGPVIVVGLGLNVSLRAEEAPVDTATSLAMLGRPGDRNVLAAAVLENLAARVSDWRAAGGASAALRADYRRLSVTLGAPVRVLMPGEAEITGTAVDLDELGRVVVDDGNARTAVAAGDVTHLRPQH